MVRQKGHLGAPALGLAGDGKRRHGFAPLVALVVDLAVPADFHLQVLGQAVHHRHADTVEAARDLVGPGVELAAGVEAGHDHFHRGEALGGVYVHRDAPAVILHGDALVRVDLHFDFGAVPAHGLVDGVIHRLVDQVVQALDAGVADVHGGALPHPLQVFEDLDLLGAVGLHHIFRNDFGFFQSFPL